MRLTIPALASLLVSFVPSSFGATITSGFFNIAGTIYVTNVTGASAIVTPGGTCPSGGFECIFWQDSSGTMNGLVDISASGLPNGNIPASIAGNDAATAASLINPPETVGNFPPQLFMTFLNGGITTVLDISSIEPGIYSSAACTAAPAPGQQCTLPGSLFNFVNNPPPPGQATATWVLDGVTNTPGVTWTGNFSSQFPAGTPYQTVLSNLATNGFVSNTFSGTITLVVPEPGTVEFMFIGSGLIGLAALLRRRRSAR
jgi:PEP-CTERM motif